MKIRQKFEKSSIGTIFLSGEFSRSLSTFHGSVSDSAYSMGFILGDEGANLQKIQKIIF